MISKKFLMQLRPGDQLNCLVWQALHGEEPDLLKIRHADGKCFVHAGYPVGHICPPDYSDDVTKIWELIQLLCSNGIFEMSNGDGDSFDVRFIPYHPLAQTDTGANPFRFAVVLTDEISFGSVISKTIILACHEVL